MNEAEIKQIEVLTSSGIALVVTQLFRLLFGVDIRVFGGITTYVW